jgi:hypothetical protein
MDNTFSLVIWEIVPDDTNLYLIPNNVITDDLRRVLEGAHGKFINQDDDVEDTDKLQYALMDADPTYEIEHKEYLGLFVDYCVSDKSKPIVANITHVYLTGFIL